MFEVRKTAVPGHPGRLSPGDVGKEEVHLQRILPHDRLEPRPAPVPGRHQDVDRRSPTTIGNQPPSWILITLALKKARSTAGAAPVSARARHVGQCQRSQATVWSRSVVVSIVPVTAMPYAAARLLELRKPDHQGDAAEPERPVHLGDVDLADLGAGGVDDGHPRDVAQLDGLPGEGEGPGDERLRGHDGRRRRDADHRIQRPAGHQGEERVDPCLRDPPAGGPPARSS